MSHTPSVSKLPQAFFRSYVKKFFLLIAFKRWKCYRCDSYSKGECMCPLHLPWNYKLQFNDDPADLLNMVLLLVVLGVCSSA